VTVLHSSRIENSCAWLAGLEAVQRYITGAVVRDQRLFGPLPFVLGPDDIVQEVFVALIENEGRTALTPIRKDLVAAAVKRVLRRYRDRQYQRRRSGLPEVGELGFEPVAGASPEDVARLAAEVASDLGPTLSDEEAVIWHMLVTNGHKTVREIAAELGVRHQRVSDIRRKLEAAITSYLVSRE
jgi:DNA-directed RNA polymerase specialized sigma24 family protein